jgi:retron-type reverse transcriptase
MLQERIDDASFLNLIRKWLKAGILDRDGKVIHPESGTPQGGLCKALHNPPYAKKVLMQSIILKRWQNHKIPLISFA